MCGPDYLIKVVPDFPPYSRQSNRAPPSSLLPWMLLACRQQGWVILQPASLSSFACFAAPILVLCAYLSLTSHFDQHTEDLWNSRRCEAQVRLKSRKNAGRSGKRYDIPVVARATLHPQSLAFPQQSVQQYCTPVLRICS